VINSGCTAVEEICSWTSKSIDLFCSTVHPQILLWQFADDHAILFYSWGFLKSLDIISIDMLKLHQTHGSMKVFKEEFVKHLAPVPSIPCGSSSHNASYQWLFSAHAWMVPPKPEFYHWKSEKRWMVTYNDHVYLMFPVRPVKMLEFYLCFHLT